MCEGNFLIISGGSIEREFAYEYTAQAKWDALICADSGISFCREAGLIPDCIVGDFDSASESDIQYFKDLIPDRMIFAPRNKDFTDTELAFIKAAESGARQITILGAFGTRIDHVMGNLQILKAALERDICCLLIDERNRVRMIKDKLAIKKDEQWGRYISLIPFTPVVGGVTLKGFVYGLFRAALKSGSTLGLSNQIAKDIASISIEEGLLLVMESRD